MKMNALAVLWNEDALERLAVIETFRIIIAMTVEMRSKICTSMMENSFVWNVCWILSEQGRWNNDYNFFDRTDYWSSGRSIRDDVIGNGGG